MTRDGNFILCAIIGHLAVGIHLYKFSAYARFIRLCDTGVGFISYLIMYPIHRLGLKIERQINVRIQAVNNDLSKLDHSLKGEKRFEKKEEIFNKHGYTPFQNIGLAMGFIFLLPLLLSAISFFTTTDLVVEKAFFSIPDLGKMDGLLFGINFLPILMLSIGVLTAVYQWSREAISPVRPIIISLVVFIIVYELPSAMLIFWLSVNGAMLFVHSIDGGLFLTK